MQGYVAEFIEETARLVSNVKIEPVSFEYVYEKQSRPSQRAINKEVVDNPIDIQRSIMLKAFSKAESSPNAGAPRNITTTPPGHQMALSTITLAVKSNILKRLPWYMPGRPLPAIAQAVHGMAMVAHSQGVGLCECDYSKFDGTITESLRRGIEVPFYQRFLTEEFAPVINTHVCHEIDADCRVGTTVYRVNGSRLSGSPLTTDGNTIIAAAVAYIAQRKSGYSVRDAYERIGLHFGDDGIDFNVPCFVDVTKQLGLKLKLIELTPTDPIGFLGRVFPTPCSSPASFQSPYRVYPKLHLVQNCSSASESRRNFLSKMLAYNLSDEKTPLLGAYARAHLRANRDIMANIEAERRPYIDDGSQWPNDLTDSQKDVCLLMTSEALHCTISDVLELEKRLDRVKNRPQLSSIVQPVFAGEGEHFRTPPAVRHDSSLDSSEPVVRTTRRSSRKETAGRRKTPAPASSASQSINNKQDASKEKEGQQVPTTPVGRSSIL